MSNQAAESSNIEKIKIFSNYGKEVDVAGGVSSLEIFESVFDTTIRASANIIDTGFRNSKNTVSGMEVDDLHLTVGEKTIISVTDNKGTNLNIEMRVRAVGNVVEHTQYIG